VLGVIAGLIVGLMAAVAVYGQIDESRAQDKIAAFVDGKAGSTYESASDGFAAKFPTKPVPSQQTQMTDAGPVVFHDYVSRPGRRYVFEVGYYDFGTISFAPGRATLAGFAEGIAGELDGTVTASTPSRLDGLAAEEFTIEYEEDGEDATAVARIALHGQRAYLVAVTAPGLEQRAFDTFVSTFEFTDGAAS
jgi:hypothetical protein